MTKTWCEIRNGHVRMLRQLIDHTEEDERAAVEWAIRHLDGLPENWVAVELATAPPLPPGVLADALQDVVHQDAGASRAGHSVRTVRRNDL